MAFQLDPATGLDENVRLLGARQIDGVLKRLAVKSAQGRAVHGARKSMKRLRALLRLVKPALDAKTFKDNEGRLKEIGRSLSGARDFQAMLECIDRLEASDPRTADQPVGAALKEHLEGQRLEAESRLVKTSSAKLQKQLRAVKKSFAALQIGGDGADIIAASIKKDYATARDAFHHACQQDEDEAFHDCRKLVQRHWRQLLLLEAVWPAMMRPHIDAVHDLARMLGDDHDLYILAIHIRDAGKALGSEKRINAYLVLCRKRQDILRHRVRLLGERLFAEKPSSLAARLTACWSNHREFSAQFGDRMPAVEPK